MDRYHTYGFEWNENTLIWYVDGVQVGSYKKSSDSNVLNQGQWPFDKEFYIILNQSVGNGSWAQNADITHTYQMDVDWVRVYQKKSATSIENLHSDGLILTTQENQITVKTEASAPVLISSISGILVYNGMLTGSHTFQVNKGIYLVNNKKVVVP